MERRFYIALSFVFVLRSRDKDEAVTHTSCFLQQKFRIRHTVDVMHVEKNVSASILGFILGDKDTVAVRKDLEDVGLRPELHVRPGQGGGSFVKPQAPYSLKPNEVSRFLGKLGSIKVPTGYSAGMTKHVNDRKLQSLKSHDHHVILQDILPACVRGYLEPGARDAVIRLGNCFKKICTKVVDPAAMGALQNYVAETMCLLEVWFPPAFFDIMPHLVLHLVEELDWFGPVHTRWCYGAERYLYVLKKSVRNRAKPEASIANGYMYAESLGFLGEHLSLYPGHFKMWDPEENERNGSEVLQGAFTRRHMGYAELRAVHEFVICNTEATETLRE